MWIASGKPNGENHAIKIGVPAGYEKRCSAISAWHQAYNAIETAKAPMNRVTAS
jgi:hypothetical protein